MGATTNGGGTVLVQTDWVKAHVDRVLAEAEKHRQYLQALRGRLSAIHQHIDQVLRDARFLIPAVRPGWTPTRRSGRSDRERMVRRQALPEAGRDVPRAAPAVLPTA